MRRAWTETYDYNNRLQLVRSQLKAAGSTTDIACAVYNYYAGTANPTSCAIPTQGTGDDGNVAGHYDQDNVNTSLSHTAAFTYDAEHRLTAAVATGNSTYNLAYAYDRFGNMTCTQNQQTQGLCPQYGFNGGTNQINNSGFSYDASGDMLSDNAHTYQYDAEHRLISVDNGSTAAYVYNALGERVEKSAGGAYTEYVFGQARQPMGEYNRSAWTDSWVTFEGRHFAHFSNGDTYFVHADRIGTTNIVTDWNTGTVIQDELHYPWGQVWTSAGSSIEERFAGLQHRDSESNLDPTEYRMFSSDDGRWTTPDPADQMSANPLNPQSWNRYAYVQGNSINNIDPFGLECTPGASWMLGACGLINYVNQTVQDFNNGVSDATGYIATQAESAWNTMTTVYSYVGPVVTILGGGAALYNTATQPEVDVLGLAAGGLGIASGGIGLAGYNNAAEAGEISSDALGLTDNISGGNWGSAVYDGVNLVTDTYNALGLSSSDQGGVTYSNFNDWFWAC